MSGVGEEVKRLRQAKGWTQEQLAVYAGSSQPTVNLLEAGKRNPSATTLEKLARALGVEVAEFFPKGLSSSPEPSFDDVLDDERRTAWEATVGRARDLRDPVRAQMWRARNEWRASKRRGEADVARRGYLDEMGNLLQEAYGAYTALGEAYIQAALTQGGSDASVPSYLREETQAANDFYVEMFGLVRSAGLTIRTGANAATAKRDAKIQPEVRPHSVQEAG
jgi:putative transcriptional regulator